MGFDRPNLFNVTTWSGQQNEVYEYPDLWVCLFNTYGCDDIDYEEKCVMSVNDTEGGFTRARYRPGNEGETPVYYTANVTDKVTGSRLECNIKL